MYYNHPLTVISLAAVMFLGLMLEPALAGNRFETIGGGVSGSTEAKLALVRPISIGFGVFFLIGAVLSASKRWHENANSPNYSLWKQSVAVLSVLSLASFAIAIFI